MGNEHSEETAKETEIYRRHHALKGVVNTSLHEIVEDFPSIPRHEAEKRAGRLSGTLRENIEDLTDADIIREIDGGIYMGLAGITASDERDRVPEGTIHGDYSTYINPNSGYRQSQHWHDHALAKVHSRLAEIGIYSVQGRRLNIAYKTNKAKTGANSTTLKPDLWGAVPTNDGVIVWHALEVDRSAYSQSTRQQKVRPLLGAKLNDNTRSPYLLIADRDTRGNWSAEQRARAMRLMFGNLPALATTLEEFLNGDSFGSTSVWRKGAEARIVDINHLAKLFEEEESIAVTFTELWAPWNSVRPWRAQARMGIYTGPTLLQGIKETKK